MRSLPSGKQPLGVTFHFAVFDCSPASTIIYFCFTKCRQCYKYMGLCKTSNTAYSVETAAINKFEKCRSAGRKIVSAGRLIVNEFEKVFGFITFLICFISSFRAIMDVYHSTETVNIDHLIYHKNLFVDDIH